MKLISVLCACLLITAATELAARAQLLEISATGTVSSTEDPYAYYPANVIGSPVDFTFDYDGSVAGTSGGPEVGLFYPTDKTWSLTYEGTTVSSSADNGDNGIQVLATIDGDALDGFNVETYDAPDNVAVELAFQPNTPLPNEDLGNLQTVLQNFNGTDGMTIYDSDGDGLLGVDLTSFSVSTIPEPSTWTMLAGGLVLAGLHLRRRRDRQIAGR
jgi:hypothetical protein